MSISSWMSLYVPVVPSDLSIGGLNMNNEMAFQHYFEYMLPMGKVGRVDFVSKDSPQGNYKITSAFVHFDSWFDMGKTYNEVRSMLEEQDELTLYGGASDDGEFKNFVSSKNPAKNRFITIKINKAPIRRQAEIPKNIHQIINNYGRMEEFIAEQGARISELEGLVSRLRATILEMENSEGTVYDRAPSVIEDEGPMSMAELAE